MQTITIYHNPRCSKSRKTLELLQSRGLEPLVIDYLKTPLDVAQLHQLRSHFNLNEFVRTNEPVFKESGLSLENEDQIIEAMAKHPILMQRPIVTYQGKAIIGRPPEQVLEILK
ncbi:arsenate reductase (glutaredoxin) [Legionella quateirensis]|uniref:Arsenate reductase n=1 Tax=Legionella quateirensis TaxID=45072 RepID=A0A378KUQ2_9GAMM|nr:arsenate reductase (glutaredoxin) [Legionella quateirensis]KTD43407.1 oxidoreductase [Legionella quateirensis]STY18293.1 oxidoreductase [Legionella quateirensis]